MFFSNKYPPICFDVVMDEGRWRLHVRHVFCAVSTSQRMTMIHDSKASLGVHLRGLFGGVVSRADGLRTKYLSKAPLNCNRETPFRLRMSRGRLLNSLIPL